MRRSATIHAVPGFYHIYNRGAGKRRIFEDARDKAKFLSLLGRYLDDEVYIRGDGIEYEKIPAKLVAYCLMGNHFHLMLCQDQNPDDVQRLVKSVCSAYARYYNLRHKSSGYLFQGQFRAKHIDSDSYFEHLSRYIHLNPRTYATYKWSSLPEYTGRRDTPWIHHELATTRTPEQYLAFLSDYTDRAKELKKLREELDLL